MPWFSNSRKSVSRSCNFNSCDFGFLKIERSWYTGHFICFIRWLLMYLIFLYIPLLTIDVWDHMIKCANTIQKQTRNHCTSSACCYNQWKPVCTRKWFAINGSQPFKEEVSGLNGAVPATGKKKHKIVYWGSLL